MAAYSGPEIPNSGLVYNLDAANSKNFGLTAVQVLVVAGGGGSGGGGNSGYQGGGGGGGGVVYHPNFSITPGTAYTVTVGAGGTAGVQTGDSGFRGGDGGNSVFSTLTAVGGGGGGGNAQANGNNGGSGGGGNLYSGTGGTSTQTSFSGAFVYGNSGGSGQGNYNGGGAGGGGGGAGSAGGSASGTGVGGAGGQGIGFDLSGSTVYYGGGGAAQGGAGNGIAIFGATAANTAGSSNTGAGGGGRISVAGMAGGSGIVIVRYPGPQRATGGTVTRVGNDTVHTFTSTGSTTFTPASSGTLLGLTDHSNVNSFATATNTPTYNSSNNGSIVFNGSSNYVSGGALSGSFASFTVFIWFYPTSVASFQNPIDCNYSYNGTTGNIGPRLEMNSSGNLNWVYSNITNSNGSYYGHEVVNSGLAANTWHCAVITYNGSTSATYYNGSVTAYSRTTTGSPTGFIGVMNNITVGRGFHLGGAERYFAGRVGETLIYNRALTAAEISTLFEASRDRYGV